MRPTIIWEQLALDTLAEIWLNSVDRAAVRLAASAIDAELSDHADRKGVDLSEGLRKIIVPPLGCIFHVELAERKVIVDSIQRLRDC